MKKDKIISFALASILLTSTANAAEGYLTDKDGGIVKSKDNVCWHVGSFNKDTNGLDECSEGGVSPVAEQAVEESAPEISTTVFRLQDKTLFGFDSSQISQSGKETLNDIVQQILSSQVSLQEVQVVGHTDVIGNRQYNINLSKRRADAVANYIVQGGVPAYLVTSEGVGPDQAQISKESCRGSGNKAQYLECFAPDRKVEILVTGETRN